MARVLECVRHRDWRFHLQEEPLALQVHFIGVDASSGLPALVHGRKWLLSEHMTKSELVQTAFKAVVTALEHEAREHFLYKGRPVFGPHFDVDELSLLAASGNRDVRAAP